MTEHRRIKGDPRLGFKSDDEAPIEEANKRWALDDRVAVSHGDLLEALQSATAWAGYLRQRTPSAQNYIEAADRIDAAVARLRAQSYGE